MEPHGYRAALLGLIVVLFLPAPSAAREVKSGKILVGKGAAGVQLGMSADEVVAKLGDPEDRDEDNPPLWMGFSKHPAVTMFDVYFDPAQDPPGIRMISLAGGSFTVGRYHVFKRGAMRRLIRRFGSHLKPVTLETGDHAYRLRGRFKGRRVWTQFDVWKPSRDSLVRQVEVLFPNWG